LSRASTPSRQLLPEAHRSRRSHARRSLLTCLSRPGPPQRTLPEVVLIHAGELETGSRRTCSSR
jgi:hypothetical protein